MQQIILVGVALVLGALLWELAKHEMQMFGRAEDKADWVTDWGTEMSMDREDVDYCVHRLFLDTMESLGHMPQATEQMARAQDLFGRRGTRVAMWLTSGGEWRAER